MIVKFFASFSVATTVVDSSPTRRALEPSFVGHVCLGANNWLDATLGALFIKIDDAIHIAVIGNA